MGGPNGHVRENGASISVESPAASVVPAVAQFPAERVKELVAASARAGRVSGRRSGRWRQRSQNRATGPELDE
jgi:hypothetical protein